VDQATHQARPWPNSSPSRDWRCLRWPSRSWLLTCAGCCGRLRAAASYSQDARDCSSSAWTSEGQARTRSHGGLGK
jgi:hypothetical protein